MKRSDLYRKFILSLLFFASPLRANAADEDAIKVRDAISKVCLDSWCEGGFEYKFQQVLLKTAQNEFEVIFRMTQKGAIPLAFTEDQDFKAQIDQRFYDVSCKIPGYSTSEAILQTPKLLRWDVYNALNRCISALQERVLRVNAPSLSAVSSIIARRGASGVKPDPWLDAAPLPAPLSQLQYIRIRRVFQSVAINAWHPEVSRLENQALHPMRPGPLGPAVQ